MIKKIIFVFALGLAVQTITGCVDCNCGPTKDVFFTKKSLSLKNIDSALPHPMVSTAAIIPSVRYGIQVQIATEQIALRKQSINWGLMQTAYACSCDVDDTIPKEDIVTIEIFSNNDFDASHPKNTDLNLYFKVKHYNNLFSIVDYIKFIKGSRDFAMSSFNDGILLQTAPQISKKHKFRLKITLSDGRILEAEAPEVELS